MPFFASIARDYRHGQNQNQCQVEDAIALFLLFALIATTDGLVMPKDDAKSSDGSNVTTFATLTYSFEQPVLLDSLRCVYPCGAH